MRVQHPDPCCHIGAPESQEQHFQEEDSPRQRSRPTLLPAQTGQKLQQQLSPSHQALLLPGEPRAATRVSILISALGTRQRFPRCGTSRTPSTISGGDDPDANGCEDKLGPPTTTLQGPSVHSLSKRTRLKPRGDAMTKRHLPRTAVPARELSLISANALSREETLRIT